MGNVLLRLRSDLLARILEWLRKLSSGCEVTKCVGYRLSLHMLSNKVLEHTLFAFPLHLFRALHKVEVKVATALEVLLVDVAFLNSALNIERVRVDVFFFTVVRPSSVALALLVDLTSVQSKVSLNSFVSHLLWLSAAVLLCARRLVLQQNRELLSVFANS